MTKEELTNVVLKAMLARNAVRAYKNKNKISPKVKLKEVLDFQNVEPGLSKDSFWGPNSVEAVTYYLKNTKDPEVPGFHPAFAKTVITWKPPVIDLPVKAAVVEAPPPKPVEPVKPAVKPVVVKEAIVPPKKPKEKIKKKKKIAVHKIANVVKEDTKYGQAPVNGDIDAEEHIAKDHISAPIKEIKRLLKEESVSKKVSGEHKKVVNKSKFEKDVVGRLKDLQGRVEAMQVDTAAKKKKAKDYRIMGLIL